MGAKERERILASVDTMIEETTRALEQLTPGRTVDLYSWTRHLAMRIALRGLFGLDPDGGPARSIDAAGLFEHALAFFSAEYARALAMLAAIWPATRLMNPA